MHSSQLTPEGQELQGCCVDDDDPELQVGGAHTKWLGRPRRSVQAPGGPSRSEFGQRVGVVWSACGVVRFIGRRDP